MRAGSVLRRRPARPGRRFSPAGLLLAALAVAVPARAGSPALFGPPPALLPASVAEYAAAMSALKQRAMFGAPLPRGTLVPPAGVPFLWRAENGDTLRRMEDGVFKLTTGNCVSSLCSEQACYAQAWPVFVCDDEQPRTMSAPDADTVIFDDTVFRRARERPQAAGDQDG